MNMCALECGEDVIVIDCGQRVPMEDTPGVDLIVPDITHLEKMRGRLRAIVLTHGHEDHIGALPYLWPRLGVPIFGRRLTLALVREKLREFGLHEEVQLHEVQPREEIVLGSLRVKFIHVTHSIAEASALIISTPIGIIVHTGDYRIDDTPLAGDPLDHESLREAGERGVLALLADSTNVGRPGRTRSEAELVPVFEKLIGEAPRSVIIGCFASATHRHGMIAEIAHRLDKRIFVAGMSMAKNIRIFRELGLLTVPGDVFADLAEYGSLPPEKRIVLASGSQGEPMSALSKIALDEHRHVSLERGDRVILSARIIPGNERSIFRMINHLYRREVEVYSEADACVHTSGHAYRDEMAEMIRWVRPRHLIPIHGEIRHLIEHRRLAVEMGIPEENVFVVENGNIVEITVDGARRAGDCHAGRVFVDGVGDVSEIVLRDRKHLANDGFLVVILAVDHQTFQIAAGPDLVSRGLIYVEESEEVLEGWRRIVRETFADLPPESREESAVVEEAIRAALRRKIRKQFSRRPLILPVVMEV
jgi:ribonuclease J